jgi:thymidine phosphorylase
MAIFLQGMEPVELTVWTDVMIESGERLDLGDLGRPTVDKNSTGGVGDKISAIAGWSGALDLSEHRCNELLQS